MDNKKKNREIVTANINASEMIVENIFSVNELCNFKKEKPIESTTMIDMKNASTDYLQRTSGTFNNISMLFAGNLELLNIFFED